MHSQALLKVLLVQGRAETLAERFLTYHWVVGIPGFLINQSDSGALDFAGRSV